MPSAGVVPVPLVDDSSSGLGYLRRSALAVGDRYRRDGPGNRPWSAYVTGPMLFFGPAWFFWSFVGLSSLFALLLVSAGEVGLARGLLAAPVSVGVVRWYARPLPSRPGTRHR